MAKDQDAFTDYVLEDDYCRVISWEGRDIPVHQSSVHYTTQNVDTGTVIRMDSSVARNFTIHEDAEEGFEVVVIQEGTGQITVLADGTGAILNRQSHTKTAGQYARINCYVISNAGTAPQVILSGDTGT